MKGSAFRTGLTGLATALALAGCGFAGRVGGVW
jgi:hypothetical protein